MIQQLDKRPNKMHDTAIGAHYLFNGGYNPITNVLADSPQSHVVLLSNGTIRISGKIHFPFEHKAYRDASTNLPTLQALCRRCATLRRYDDWTTSVAATDPNSICPCDSTDCTFDYNFTPTTGTTSRRRR